MGDQADFNTFYEAWAANTNTSLHFLPQEWGDETTAHHMPPKSFSAPPTAASSPFPMDFTEPPWDWSDSMAWDAYGFSTGTISGPSSHPIQDHQRSDHRRLIPDFTQSAASSPRTLCSSTSASPSPKLRKAAPRSSPEVRGRSTEQQSSEPMRRLSRKAQNRAAQQAHRERKRKLIEDLWTEIHNLRLRNGQLQKELQAKTEMLQYVCRQ